MIPLIGQLYRNNNVVTSIHGRGLINRSVIAIMKAHRFARHRMADDAEPSVHETFPILKAMSELLGAASVDLGKMVAKFKAEGNGRSIEDFVRPSWPKRPASRTAMPAKAPTLYGFGRIGRLLARILIEDRRRRRPAPARDRRAQGRRERPGQAGQPAASGLGARSVRRHHHHRRRKQHADRQRQPDPGDLLQRPGVD